jgi:hypothetical protein
MIIMKRFLLIPLLSIAQLLPVFANELDDFCARRAVGTIAELRHEHYPQLSQREIEIARKAAVLACIDSRTASFSGDDTDTADGQSNNGDTNDQRSKDDKSWVERLLDNDKKEDLTPMMKQHTTGGK